MDGMQMLGEACVSPSMGTVLLIWMGVGSLLALAWPWLSRLSSAARRMSVLPLFVLALLAASVQPAHAVVPGEGCEWLNEQQWPCWMIEALWCPCTWDDPPPLPPPPPPNPW